MAFVSIPNGVRVVHLGHIGTVQIVNTIGTVNGAGESGSSLSDIATSHATSWRAHIVTQMNSQYVHDDTLAYSLEDQSLAAGDAALGAGLAGTFNNDLSPLSACMVVSFKTAKRGRTYQGRTFMSGFSQADVAADGRSWDAAKVALMQTAMEAYKADVDPTLGDNGKLAVCSKGAPDKGILPHVEPVTGILVRSAIGTQRRRLS